MFTACSKQCLEKRASVCDRFQGQQNHDYRPPKVCTNQGGLTPPIMFEGYTKQTFSQNSRYKLPSFWSDTGTILLA